MFGARCRAQFAHCVALLLVVLCHADGETNAGPILGIDLGTTFSCVGIYRNGQAEIVVSDQGSRLVPSYVAFIDGEVLVGDAAKHHAMLNPSETVYNAKRFIGRRYEDPEVQRSIGLLSASVVERDTRPAFRVEVAGEARHLSPEEISGLLLKRLKHLAEAHLGSDVKQAVISVPAHFDDAQRQATKEAGSLGGLEVVRIISEPIAAALAFGLDAQGQRTMLVYDLGGGTLDVSVVRVDGGVFTVLATNGDPHLGGEDFDERVTEYLMGVFEKKYQKSAGENRHAVQRLRVEVEKVKRRLSSAPQVRMKLENFHDGLELSESLTRARFESLNKDLFLKTLDPLRQVLQDAGLEKSAIDDIVLVGGSSRIPKVQQLVKEFFDGKEPARGINADEAIAQGAAIQAGLLQRPQESQEVSLVDVVPLSLGVETVGGIMTSVIGRNTALPAENTMLFTTHFDDQQALTIKVFEGERPVTRHNHLLKKFQLRGIAPAPRGRPKIEVSFKVDVNGVLKVEAQDITSVPGEKIFVTHEEKTLQKSDIDERVEQAKRFAESDQRTAEALRTRVLLERFLLSFAWVTGSSSGPDSVGVQLSDHNRRTLLEVLAQGKEWLVANPDADVEDVQKRLSEIQAACDDIISGSRGDESEQGGSSEEEIYEEL